MYKMLKAPLICIYAFWGFWKQAKS